MSNPETTTTTTTETAPASVVAQAVATTTDTTTTAAATTTDNKPVFDWVPEKYQVKKDDGELDLEASAKKLAEAHGHLEKRLGSGDAPPKTPEEYAPTIPEGFTEEALKADPLYQEFTKQAHERGISNDNMSWLLETFASRTMGSAMITADECVETLKTVWNDDKAYAGNMQSVGRTMRAYGDPNAEAVGSYARLEAKYGNDPDFLVFSARIGAELKEDRPASQTTVDAKAWDDQLTELKAHPAYADTKHPEHKAVMAKKSELYKKRYG